MNWLFEQPLVIVGVGAVLLVGLGAVWSSTVRQELLYALAGIFGLIVAGLIVERLVVTDREAIRATLLQIAHDVESNNHGAVLKHIHSGAPQLAQRAKAELPNYQFSACS